MYMPITPKLKDVTKLNEIQTRLCKSADKSGKILNYVANRFFSPNFKRDKYYFEEDIWSFWTNFKKDFEEENIGIMYTRIDRMITNTDYVHNVIEQLAWNIKEHAFNPENDIKKRTNKEDFYKIVEIEGKPEKEIPAKNKQIKDLKKPAEKGNYIVTMKDNGFGIKEQHLENIFKKGFSTKNDKTTDHGIGLWGAKEFVEKNGGEMSVETKLGEGTEFKFTIPYTKVDEGYCIQ